MRYAWACPTTLFGLALAMPALRHGRIMIVDGVMEAHGPFLDWCLSHLIPIPGGAAAVTLGHVVVGRDQQALESTRSHERVHVAQYERWGPFFVPVYFAASLWAVLRGRHFYFDNCFERAASELSQGHPAHHHRTAAGVL